MEILPRVITQIPGKKSKKIIEVSRKYECSGLKTFLNSNNPIIFYKTKDSIIEDYDGNTFLDITGSFGAAAIGHCNDNIIEAITKQSKYCIHCPSNYPSPTRAELLKLLIKIAPKGLDRVCFAVTGTEANEISIKLAKSFLGKHEFICFYGGYFGRSLSTLRLGSKSKYKDIIVSGDTVHFMPYPYCYRCLFNLSYPGCGLYCLEYIKKVIRNPVSGLGEIAGMILEPIQVSSGCIIPPKGYLKGIREICDENDFLMILDEIQTGFGRTGKLWAADQDSISADMVTTGKGLGGGLPVAAVFGKEKIMTHWKSGYHTTTFLTNALLQSAGVAAIKLLIKNDYIKKNKEKGIYFLNLLKKFIEDKKLVGDIRGIGLVLGIELVKDKKTKEPAKKETKLVQDECLRRGILIQVGGWYDNVLRISPPYSINKIQMDFFAKEMAKILNIFEKK